LLVLKLFDDIVGGKVGKACVAGGHGRGKGKGFWIAIKEREDPSRPRASRKKRRKRTVERVLYRGNG